MNKATADNQNDVSHPLHYTWVFWFMHRVPGAKITNYEDSMKRIAQFSTASRRKKRNAQMSRMRLSSASMIFTIEDFWAVYSHLRRPFELPTVSDYHLFKYGVRPVWEDGANINGGKWIVRLKKGLASRYWENLVLAIIGDQFEVKDEICGAVLSIRSSEDIISVWNKTALNNRINLRIRDTIKRVLALPSETVMEYKSHNDALRDRSSFRNTDVFR
ncbi:translation initiation factor eIF 4e-like domain-containing protein [Dichotomocladium elegans]|nr:translation initiation factor eIF 4e-like domain-containing protein [Dichotomocladium elegans]